MTIKKRRGSLLHSLGLDGLEKRIRRPLHEQVFGRRRRKSRRQEKEEVLRRYGLEPES